MKIGIMQPYFFPYLGYWQLINAVDQYIVYDNVNFIKGGWISRNNILLDGKKHMITLPLDGSSPFKLISEIEITPHETVKRKLIKTIQSAYMKAPYYDLIMPMIEELIDNNHNIAILNYQIINKINNYLDIDTEIVLSSSLHCDNGLKGQEKIIAINKSLNSNEYYNAIGGVELYNSNDFMKNGILLRFLRMNEHSYKQFDNKFVSGLSIIDVLMFNNKDQIQKLLNAYDLQ